jgi:hypothetical protein
MFDTLVIGQDRPVLPPAIISSTLDCILRFWKPGPHQPVPGRSLSVLGLFYVGLSFQRTYASATIRGVGPDAALVVRQLQHRLRSSVKRSVTRQPH